MLGKKAHPHPSGQIYKDDINGFSLQLGYLLRDNNIIIPIIPYLKTVAQEGKELSILAPADCTLYQ
jgi:hypothetical protein